MNKILQILNEQNVPQKYLQGKKEERLPLTHPQKQNLNELNIAQGKANYQ